MKGKLFRLGMHVNPLQMLFLDSGLKCRRAFDFEIKTIKIQGRKREKLIR